MAAAAGGEEDGFEVAPDNVDVHATIPTQTAVKTVFHKSVEDPDCAKATTLNFDITTAKGCMIDPNETYLYLESQLVPKAGGEVLASRVADPGNPANMIHNEGSNFVFVNGLSHAWFDKCWIKINGETLNQINSVHYATRGDIETRLGLSERLKEGQMQASGFTEEEIAFEDITDDASVQFASVEDPPDDGFDHVQIIKRYDLMRDSKSYCTLGRIHHEIFQQTKFLPPKTELNITFHRNHQNFILLSKKANSDAVTARITKAKILYRECEMDEEYLKSLEASAFKGEVMKYPIRRVNMSSYHIPGLISDLGKSNLLPGESYLPRRMIVVVTTEGAAVTTGNLNLDPFNYQSFNIAKIGLKIGNSFRPYEEEECNFESGKTLIIWKNLMDTVNAVFQDPNPGINYFNYKRRNCFFGFNISSQFTEPGEAFELAKKDTLALCLSTDPGHPVAAPGVRVFIYAEYDGEIHFVPDGEGKNKIIVHADA